MSLCVYVYVHRYKYNVGVHVGRDQRLASGVFLSHFMLFLERVSQGTWSSLV